MYELLELAGIKFQLQDLGIFIELLEALNASYYSKPMRDAQVDLSYFSPSKHDSHDSTSDAGRRFLATAKRSPTITDGHQTIVRTNHGLAHIIRCMAYVPVVVAYLKQYGNHAIQSQFSDSVDLDLLVKQLMYCMAFSSIGRESEIDNKEQPEVHQAYRKAAGEIFEAYWLRDAFGQQCFQTSDEMQRFKASLVAMGDPDNTDPIPIVMNIAYKLDSYRCHTAYSAWAMVNFYMESFSKENAPIDALLTVVKNAIDATGDRNKAFKKRRNISKFVACSADPRTCILHLSEIFNGVSLTEVSPAEPELRQPALIKLIRADASKYFEKFVDSVTSTPLNHPMLHALPLRQPNRFPFSIKARYDSENNALEYSIVNRAQAMPQYTLAQKEAGFPFFGKPQSTSYVHPAAGFLPPVFQLLTNRTDYLVGVHLPIDSALLTRLISEDISTYHRPTDFCNLEIASHFLHHNVWLFKSYAQLEAAGNLKGYNEVLARLRYSANWSICIFTDNLPSRLLAIRRQRYFQHRITEMYAEVNAVVPVDLKIAFYDPRSGRNLRFYSVDEQEQDMQEARDLVARGSPLNTVTLLLNLLKAIEDPTVCQTFTQRKRIVPAHQLAAYGRFVAFQALLQSTPNQINQTDANGNTPLHYAVVNQRWILVQFIFNTITKEKAQVKNKKGYSAIDLLQQHFIRKQREKRFSDTDRQLIEALFAAAPDGIKAILIPLWIQHAQTEVIKETFAHNRTVKTDAKLLRFAVENGREDLAIHLLPLQNWNLYPLYQIPILALAVQQNLLRLVEILLTNYSKAEDIHQCNIIYEPANRGGIIQSAPIHYASTPEMLDLLVRFNADINAEYKLGISFSGHLIELAAKLGNERLVRYLLQKTGIRLSKIERTNQLSTNSAFYWSLRYGLTSCITPLMSHDDFQVCYVNSNAVCDSTLEAEVLLSGFWGIVLKYASRATLEAIVRSSKVDPYAVNKAQRTLLHLAIQYGDLEKLNIVLAYCPHLLDHPDEHGKTALMLAVKDVDKLEAIQALLNKGANVNARDNALNTVLHGALPAYIPILCRHGVHINARNADGDTPLHVACSSSPWYSEIFEWVGILLYHGADLWLQNTFGRLPIDCLCKAKGNPNEQTMAALLYLESIMKQRLNPYCSTAENRFSECMPVIEPITRDADLSDALHLIECTHYKPMTEKPLLSEFDKYKPAPLSDEQYQCILSQCSLSLDALQAMFEAAENRIDESMSGCFVPHICRQFIQESNFIGLMVYLKRGLPLQYEDECQKPTTALLDFAFEMKEKRQYTMWNRFMLFLLLQSGADPNASSEYKETPLSILLQKGLELPHFKRIITLLLRYGANPNHAVNGEYNNVLNLMLRSNMSKAYLEEMFNLGANPFVMDPPKGGSFRVNTIEYALKKDRYDVLEWLIETGCIPHLNQLDVRGETLLIRAVKVSTQPDKTRCIEGLLSRRDIDLNVQDTIGLDAMAYAKRGGKTAVIQLITDAQKDRFQLALREARNHSIKRSNSTPSALVVACGVNDEAPLRAQTSSQGMFSQNAHANSSSPKKSNVARSCFTM